MVFFEVPISANCKNVALWIVQNFIQQHPFFLFEYEKTAFCCEFIEFIYLPMHDNEILRNTETFRDK